jgi:hypothetical protein
MGYLQDHVKSERTKKIIGWTGTILKIVLWLWLALNLRTAFQEGYDMAKSDACGLCYFNTTAGSTSAHLNNTTLPIH